MTSREIHHSPTLSEISDALAETAALDERNVVKRKSHKYSLVDRSQQGAALSGWPGVVYHSLCPGCDEKIPHTKPGAAKAATESGKLCKNCIENAHEPDVESLHSNGVASPPSKDTIMILTRKSISKNGKAAFYSGAKTTLRIPLANFPGGNAPEMIENFDDFVAGNTPKPKLSKEERAELRKNTPKPTAAELIARKQAALDKLKAKLAADEANG